VSCIILYIVYGIEFYQFCVNVDVKVSNIYIYIYKGVVNIVLGSKRGKK